MSATVYWRWYTGLGGPISFIAHVGSSHELAGLGGSPYNRINLLKKAALVHRQEYHDNLDDIALPAEVNPYGHNGMYLWKVVFNAVYACITVHKGFGMKVTMTDEGRDTLVTDIETTLTHQHPELHEDPSLLYPLREFLHSCVTAGAGAKQYSLVDPNKKPWALGMALIYASNQHWNFGGDKEFSSLVSF